MNQGSVRATFVGAWGATLATAGVAIGLGNIWRFPYMMGQHGGSAFLLVYLVLVVAFGIPALMTECALGRYTRRGPMGAFEVVGVPGARLWSLLLLTTILMAASYYGVVLARVLRFAVSFSRTAVVTDAGGPVIPPEVLSRDVGYVIVTVVLSCAVLWLGVRKGIERLSSFGLPVFFLLFLILIGRVLTLDGATDGLRQFLNLRLGDFTPGTFLGAMGQVFFSLSLGGTFMVVYGSYMRNQDSIPRLAAGTALADLSAALMASLIVIPSVFVFGKDLASGPSLVFEVMPAIFGRMHLGSVFGAGFFFAVFLVGLLSLVAAYEVLVAAGEDAGGLSRKLMLALILVTELLLSLPPLLIPEYIRYSDMLWGSTMQPLGSAVTIVAFVWCVSRARTLEELRRSSRLPVPTWLFYWIKYVIPAGIVATLISGWL